MVTSNQLTYLESDEVTEHEVLHTSRPLSKAIERFVTM